MLVQSGIFIVRKTALFYSYGHYLYVVHALQVAVSVRLHATFTCRYREAVEHPQPAAYIQNYGERWAVNKK